MKTGSCCGAPDEANRSIPQGTVGGAMVPVALLLSAPGTVVHHVENHRSLWCQSPTLCF